MNELKLKWNEPEIIDLAVKETESGPNQSDNPDGGSWWDPKHGSWERPYGKS